MPTYVSKHHIHEGVVKEWKRLMVATAKDRGDDLSTVQAFHPYEQTYSEVLREVKSESAQGLEFYRRMIPVTPGYTFHEDDIVLFAGKAELVRGLDKIRQSLGSLKEMISRVHTPQVTFHHIVQGPKGTEKDIRTQNQGPSMIMPPDIPITEEGEIWLLEHLAITDELRSFTRRDYDFNARLVPKQAPLQEILTAELEHGQFPIPDSLIIIGEVREGYVEALRTREGEIGKLLGLEMFVYNAEQEEKVDSQWGERE